MNAQPHLASPFVRPPLNDCWNRIGVHGDKSCVELEQHLHCRNCPVYSTAARTLLDAPLPPDYTNLWTRHFAQPSVLAQAATHSVIIFRLGSEWLALPTVLCSEVADTRPIHTLPHRRNSAVLGIANVRGELLVCLSLTTILGLNINALSGQDSRNVALQRLLVFRGAAAAVVFPVDEVHSVYRYGASQLIEVPATVSKAQATYTRAVLSWNQRTVGVLDEKLLFYTVDRSLA
jgi:Chemotaxis signal transduction protein